MEERVRYFANLLVIFSMLAIGAGCCTSVRTIAPPVLNEEQKNISVAERVIDSTVALVIGPEEDKTSYCAGVWIDSNTILTANHCAEVIGRTIFEVPESMPYSAIGDPIAFVNHSDISENGELPKGIPWLGVIQNVDKEKDLAQILVVANTSTHSVVNLAEGKLPPGQEVHIVGHTLSLGWSYTRGYISSAQILQGPEIGSEAVISKVFQISAPVWVGNSGGGAFDSTGKLIGICSWVNIRGPSISYFIHRDEIKKFLNIKALKP
jgi:S1-C subfamily serine protease